MSKLKHLPQKNSEIQLSILKWHPKGFGVGLVGDFPVWVADALPGERGIVRILKLTATHAFGRRVSRELGALGRVVPTCPVAVPCGGCQLLHVDAKTSAQFKLDLVSACLSDSGLNTSRIEFFEAMATSGFRNQGRFSTQLSREGDLLVGLFGMGNQQVVDFGDTCIVQHPLSNLVVQTLRNIHKSTPIFPFIQSIVTRVAFNTSQLLVGLSGPTLPHELSDHLIENLRKIPELNGIIYWQSDAANWTAFSDNPTVLWGDSIITETILGRSYRYDISSFFQSNPAQSETLVNRVLFHLNPEFHHVLDLYCGVGLFSLAVAATGKSVTGIEFSATAIKFAKQNAIDNRIPATFISGDAAEFKALCNTEFEALIVDPPRTGLSQVVRDQLKSTAFKQIIYVSCNPESLASDLADLCQTHYQITGIEIVDMFPGSYHCETVAILISKA